MVFIDSFEGVQSLAKWGVLKTSCTYVRHSPFTIEDSGEEKGMGMFATRPIARGDLIMRERPFYVSHPALTVNEDQRHIFHASALAGLSPTAQAALAALRNAHPVSTDMPPARGRLLTNALPAEVPHAPGSRHAALYPVLCRANHACTPNARYGFDADACAGRLVALHDIAPGEEITIGYTEVAAPRDTRRAALREKYRFECECATCELPKGSAKESDARRAAIRKYMTGMLEGERFLDRVDIAHAKELIAWAEEEGLVEAVTVLAISAMRVARRKKDFLEEFRQVVNVAYYIRTVEGKDSALFAQLARRMGLSTKQLAALLENSTPETLDYGMFHGLLTARANR
ncbi:SET domain-containing protein [Mycena vitilis]|nr:SET domain-containing protein [Mycena vitilis]